MSNDCKENPPPLPPPESEEKLRQWQECQQECADPDQTPLITEEELKSSMPDMLAKLGIKSCKTFAGVRADCGWGGCGMSAGIGTAGCEQIQVIASKLLMQTRIQMCMLNKISQEKEERTYVNQDIEVHNIDSIMECTSGFNVSNTVKINKIDRTAFSAAMSNVMSAEILQTITESFQQQQEQKTGFLATSAGQRLLSDVLTAINTDVMLQTINCSIQKIMDHIEVGQKIKIVNGPRSIIRGNQCNITNNFELDKTSESIVLSSMQSVMDVKAVTDYFKAMSLFQENKAEGFSLGLGGVIAIIAALLIAGLVTIGLFFKYGSSVMEKEGTRTLIICITIVVILSAIIGLIVAAMNARTKREEFEKKYPPCPEEGPCVPCVEGKRCGDGPADEDDTNKPPGPCQTITLQKPARGWSSFMFLRSTKSEDEVKSNVTFPWDNTKDELTMCVGDFVNAWNGLNRAQRTHFGQLFLEQNGRLSIDEIKLDGLPPGTEFRITGDIGWWRRMGFGTDKPFKSGVDIRATSKPWP
jgi:hypothetical protein